MRGSGRMATSVVVLAAILAGALALGGCGGGGPATPAPAAATAAPASASSGGGGGGAGEALGKEILAAFDEMVGKVADAAKAKPKPADLKAALEPIYATYTARMTELNGKYKALKGSDVKEFGACNTYLGNERGKRVLAKDNTLTDVVKYYNLELGDKDSVALLSQKPVDLLDIAVNPQ